MTITVFGASGKIGRLLVQQAIGKGYKVKAYIRDKQSFPVSDENITLIEGTLDNKPQIQNAVTGADAVISLLGPPLKFWYKGTPVADGHANIVAAMKAAGVTRFITIATPSVKSPKDTSSVATVLPGIMARIIFPKPYIEIVKVGDVVKTSGLDWTIVRFIAPNDKEPAGNVKVSFGETKIGFSISRADITSFVLQQVQSKEFIRDMPIIGS